MQSTKQRIIKALTTQGKLTTQELSRILGISATAVRRHLIALETKGLIRHSATQRGMGRPSFIYQLKVKAPNVFEQSFAAFAAAIIQDLSNPNGDPQVDERFARRQSRRHQQYIALTGGETLSDRVASLAQLMESEGRTTTWQQLGHDHFILREHNCPFHRLGRRLDTPCHNEILLLKRTLQAKVERVNHILEGDVVCAYEIEDPGNGLPMEVEAYGQEPSGSVLH